MRASHVRRVVAVLTAVLLAACSSSSAEPETTGSTAAGAATPAAAGSQEPASAQPVSGAPSGEVVFGFASDGGQLYDPQATASIAVGSYLAPVFDTLVTVEDSGEITPALAESWEFADDLSTLTLQLRDDVVFHDDTPFNADAVKANIERGQTLPTSAIKEQLAPITDVTVEDDTTIVLGLEGPVGAVLPLFGGQAGMMLSPDSFENSDLATHPVGTGPWQVSDASVPGSEMVYEAFEDYWDPSVQGIERFVIRIVAPPAQTAGIIDGSLGVILMTSNPQDAPQIESAGKAVASTGLTYVYTLFLSKDGPFADEHARLALSHAIDRQAIAESILLGECEVTAQPFNPTSWAAAQDLAPPEQDSEKVASELEAAGLDELSLSIVTSSAGTLLPAIAQAIQAMAGDNGINVSVEPLPPAQLLQTYSEGGADAYFSSQTGAPDPSIEIGRLSASLSPGGEPSATLQELADEGATTVDQADRATAYQQWAEAYQEEAFHIGICQQDVKAGQAENVTIPNFVNPLTVDPRGITVTE